MRACTQHEVPLGRNQYHRIEQGCDSHGEPALVSHGVRPDGAGHPLLASLPAGEGFLLHDALPRVQCCLPSEQLVVHPFLLHDALPRVQCTHVRGRTCKKKKNCDVNHDVIAPCPVIGLVNRWP